jgi:hypothetical protein
MPGGVKLHHVLDFTTPEVIPYIAGGSPLGLFRKGSQRRTAPSFAAFAASFGSAAHTARMIFATLSSLSSASSTFRVPWSGKDETGRCGLWS